MAGAASLGSATILVVEDEALIRMAVVDQLRDSGFRVLEAADAEEAQAIFRADEPISLLFTDINMPGLDGIGLARWATGRYPGVKVIFTSGQPAKMKEASALGLLIAKPYDIETLGRRVAGVLLS